MAGRRSPSLLKKEERTAVGRIVAIAADGRRLAWSGPVFRETVRLWRLRRVLQMVVVVVGAVCGPLEGRSGSRAARILSRGLRVVGSSPTSGSESVWPHEADRYPGPA